MIKPARLRGAATFVAGVAAGAVLVGGLWLGDRSSFAAGQAAGPFPDVPASHWAAKSVAELKAKGIIQGEPGADYNGNRYVTRYEAAVLIDRFVHYIEASRKPLHTSQLDPSKMPVIPSGYAHNAMADLAQNKFAAPGSPLLQAPGTGPLKASDMTVVISQAVNRLSDRSLAPNTNGMPED